jgi:hypothetical protein
MEREELYVQGWKWINTEFQRYKAFLEENPDLLRHGPPPASRMIPGYSEDNHMIRLPSLDEIRNAETFQALQHMAMGLGMQSILSPIPRVCHSCASAGTASCVPMALLLEFRIPQPSPSPHHLADLRSLSPHTPMDIATAAKTVLLRLLARFRLPSEVRDILKGYYTTIAAGPEPSAEPFDLWMELWRHNLTFATRHVWIIDLDEETGLALIAEGEGIDHEEGPPREVKVPSITMTHPNWGGDTETWLHTLEEILAYQPPAMGMPGITTALMLTTQRHVVVLYPEADPV